MKGCQQDSTKTPHHDYNIVYLSPFYKLVYLSQVTEEASNLLLFPVFQNLLLPVLFLVEIINLANRGVGPAINLQKF